MGASKSPHGFATARGRGYRPEQVDHQVTGLIEQCDETAKRVALLTGVAQELAEEVEHMRSAALELPPQTYETLGERAQLLLSESEAAAAELLNSAETEAQRLVETIDAERQRLKEAARQEAAEARADAEAFATATVAAAQAAADELRDAARQESESLCQEAEDALREMVRHCHSLLADQQEQQVAQSDAFDREMVRRAADLEASIVAMTERSNAAMAEAKRLYGQAEEIARHQLEDAQARAAELIAQARVQEQRIQRDTQRVLREHAERTEGVRRHLAHVRGSLAALTGRPPGGRQEPEDSAHPTGPADTAPPTAPAAATDPDGAPDRAGAGTPANVPGSAGPADPAGRTRPAGPAHPGVPAGPPGPQPARQAAGERTSARQVSGPPPGR